MQALVDKIFENKSLTFIALTIVLLLVLALVLVIFRSAYGRRVKMPGGGRTRLPRLGVVDAFDLDRQRQLVIIRRDNVEHLLMIGGPNDLVIESEIIRAEGRERLREKDLRELKETLPGNGAGQGSGAAPFPGPPPWQQPELEPAAARVTAREPSVRRAPIQPAVPSPSPIASEPEPVAPAPAADHLSVASPSIAPASQQPPASPRRAPTFPLPPRRTAQPLTPPRTPREPLMRPDVAARGEEPPAPAGVFPRAPLATPFLRPSPPRQLAETMAKSVAASTSSTTSAPGAAAQPPAVAAPLAETPSEPASALSGSAEVAGAELAPPASAAEKSGPAAPEEAQNVPAETGSVSEKPADDIEAAPERVEMPRQQSEKPAAPAFDSIDSLEEEMAKLLGRGPSR